MKQVPRFLTLYYIQGEVKTPLHRSMTFPLSGRTKSRSGIASATTSAVSMRMMIVCRSGVIVDGECTNTPDV